MVPFFAIEFVLIFFCFSQIQVEQEVTTVIKSESDLSVLQKIGELNCDVEVIWKTVESGDSQKVMRVTELTASLLTDEAFQEIANLSEVRKLLISGEVSDHGLISIRNLEQLKSVRLNSAALTDQSLETIGKLKELTLLELRGSKLECGDMSAFKKLEKLRVLSLPGFSSIGDVQAEQISTIGKLEGVFLGDSSITDLGLGYLASIGNLQALDISGTQITDAGTEKLVGLEKLRWLKIDGVQISSGAIKNILEGCPNLERIIGQ
jgi:hypothetical protein